MIITNVHGISLPLAVWLLHDEYDYVADPNYISATSLLKSTKQLILSKRIDAEDRSADLSEFVPRAFGHAVHDSMEKAWRVSGRQAMRKLGYPGHVADRITVNPTAEELELNPDILPVWIEQRSERVLDGFRIGGKFDMVVDGELFDTKTTSVFSFMSGSKDDDYSMQGSIYRWLNPTLITGDEVHIQFVFTDWKRSEARQQAAKGYPPIKTANHSVKLHSLADTEAFIRAKIAEVRRCRTLSEDQIPDCTDKELWRSAPKFKFYADPAKANDPNARSTKNFDTLSEANAHKANQGKGIVITQPGEVKACEYCPAFEICNQRKQYYVD